MVQQNERQFSETSAKNDICHHSSKKLEILRPTHLAIQPKTVHSQAGHQILLDTEFSEMNIP
jgi:hypothetical protein